MDLFHWLLLLALVAIAMFAWHQRTTLEASRQDLAQSRWRHAQDVELATLSARQAERRADLERAELRKENRRLMKAVILMKQQPGMILPPEATDERWGTYAITPEAELAEVERRKKTEASDSEMDEADREVLSMLDGL